MRLKCRLSALYLLFLWRCITLIRCQIACRAGRTCSVHSQRSPLEVYVLYQKMLRMT
uniref:Uncharacterized protein n=1 Tax=Anguilla anguilla TaxID=7936 RepID=A0A0E9WG67_ANGAN